MRLLLDQGLPRRTASILRSKGLDVVHTGEIGLATAIDRDILQFARSEQRIVVTLDSDFHMELATTSENSPSVIRIRIEGLRANALAELLLHIIDDWRKELISGVLMTVQHSRIRIRNLPLNPLQ